MLFRLILWSFLPIAVSFAQSNFATLGGAVQDPQGRAIQTARVEIKARSTGAVRSTVSNEAGLFELAGVLPGEYDISVSALGFAPYTAPVRLEVGQRMNFDAVLQVGERSETVDVVAGAELLRTADAAVGEVVESRSIHDLPLNGRMLIDLVLTVPGAHVSHGAQTGDMNPLYWRPGQRSAISVGGSRPNGNYFLLDGTTNTDPTFNTLNLSLSPDTVQEFQVQTGSYSAEMGGAGGGQVNIVTRSGSSQFHGTAYHFLRNRVFDARSFNEMAEDSHLVQNQSGASLGGPLGGNLFFFANYEGLRRVKNMTMIQTVPTELETAGDFSEAGAAIFNPFSARPNPNFDAGRPVSPQNPQVLRDPFPDNRIAANLLHPAARTMLEKYVPMPNLMGDMGMNMTMMGQPAVFGAGMDSNNYLDVRSERHRNDQGTLPRRPHIHARRQSQRTLLRERGERLHAAEPARVRRVP